MLRISSEDSHGHEPITKKKPKLESGCDAKLVSFVFIGVLTLLYVITELGVAVRFQYLVLLSDGFHNLSDVISLFIAFWARRATKRQHTDDMSYGWGRAEILGGLTNGCFLLSLCLYVVLEAIPKFIEPPPIEGGLWFMIIAGVGLFINTLGTIVFSITGQGHSHSHGGGHSHGHGHGHKEKKKGEKVELAESPRGEKKDLDKGKDKEHDKEHNHDHKDHKDHDHKEEKKDKEKKKKDKQGDHSHSHSHDHDHGHDKKKKKKAPRDMNTHAVFLHFLGDAISSVLVLGAGVLIHFFHGTWTNYIDPVSSLVVCGLILYTTIPLVKRCSTILLQSTPAGLSVDTMKNKLRKVEGLMSVHDLHVWQLVDGMTIASVHVAVEEGVDFTHLVNEIKKIFHDFGIHSSSIQPEFVPRNHLSLHYCNQNCVIECEEDWCCKQKSEHHSKQVEEFSIKTDL